MKEVEFTPLACKKDDSLVTGTVKVRVPNMIERYEYIAQVGFKMDQDGAMDTSMDNVRSIINMVKLSQGHYISVNLKYKDGSAELKSYEEMLDDSNCEEILAEVAAMLLNGFKVSKN